MVPFRKGADGVVARESRFATRFDTLRVSDHPVCGASVASRLFINAAASPPLQGGECACIKYSSNSFTPSKARDYITRQDFFSSTEDEIRNRRILAARMTKNARKLNVTANAATLIA